MQDAFRLDRQHAGFGRRLQRLHLSGLGGDHGDPELREQDRLRVLDLRRLDGGRGEVGRPGHVREPHLPQRAHVLAGLDVVGEGHHESSRGLHIARSARRSCVDHDLSPSWKWWRRKVLAAT
ncbi:hypothetical protein [Actinomycetospora termitidis]|uniref:Uncharacterized protein n=1 Tax=Actinomycetospora termitidis TaxID=3053470 RepID=A0ABT7MFW9_9PSEU|nr:hypothetical protein [Actinomycetospora sp. Odt1-22]MDL5159044.1 hypothetical protein [Actinomycetospora sp. Odt1-22]